MALPDTLERVGIVVGSALMGMLPTGTLYLAVLPDFTALSSWPAMAAWYLPGVVVGVLVALDRLPVTYEEFWLFCLLSWLLSFGLWAAFGGSAPPTEGWPPPVALWLLAVVFAGLVTWRREWLLYRISSEPEGS